MTATVFGSSGFIGSALVKELQGKGFVQFFGGGKKTLDLTQPLTPKFINHETVYICAGVTGGAGALQADPLSFVTPNLLIHINLFDACKKAGVKKVICLSSSTGYPDTEEEVREDDYFRGELHGMYFNPGHTRRFIERLGAMYPELNIVFLRPSVVYGPGDDYDPVTSHVIPALVRKVAERQNPLIIWGDGQNWRDAVYIDDVVRALVLAADAPAGAYNIASGEGMTVTDMLNTLCLHARHRPDIGYDVSKPSMLKKRVLNTDKAGAVLRWEPTVRMVEGLARTLDWYESR